MESETKKGGTASGGEVLDGSNIMELVENKEMFGHFVDHKFQELDRDRDGQLSVKELQPAVADIGAALGLPAQGSSPDSDHIYSEVLFIFFIFIIILQFTIHPFDFLTSGFACFVSSVISM